MGLYQPTRKNTQTMSTISKYQPTIQFTYMEILDRLFEFVHNNDCNNKTSGWNWDFNQWPEGLYWSGGSLLTCMDPDRKSSSWTNTEDVDFWVTKPYWTQIRQILEWLCKDRDDVIITLNGDIITLNAPNSRTIQIIISDEQTMDAVVTNFDMLHCAGYCDGASIYLTPEMRCALLTRTVTLDIGLYRPWRWLKLARYNIIPLNIAEIRSIFQSVDAQFFVEASSQLEWWEHMQSVFRSDPVSVERSKLKEYSPNHTPLTINDIVDTLADKPVERNSSGYMNRLYHLNLAESITTNSVILNHWKLNVAFEHPNKNGLTNYTMPLRIFLPPVFANQLSICSYSPIPRMGINLTEYPDVISFLDKVNTVINAVTAKYGFVNDYSSNILYIPSKDVTTVIGNPSCQGNCKIHCGIATSTKVEMKPVTIMYVNYGTRTTDNQSTDSPFWKKIMTFKDANSSTSRIRVSVDIYGLAKVRKSVFTVKRVTGVQYL